MSPEGLFVRSSTGHEPAAGSSGAGVRGYVAWLRRLRLSPWLFQDVEWLMLGLCVGPVTGRVFECLVLACIGMTLQRGLQTFGFWWRRRDEISTV